MARVYICGGDPGVRQQLAGALVGTRAQVAEARELVQIPESRGLIDKRLVLWEPSAVPDLESLSEFRRRSLGTHVVLCVSLGHPAARLLTRYVQAGIDDLILLGDSIDGKALRNEVNERLDHTLPDDLVRDHLGGADEGVGAAESYCLRQGYRHLTADRMASCFGVNRSTVWRLMKSTSERGASASLRLGRVLHVAYQLDTTDFSVEVIARRLRFESANALYMLSERYLGVGPVEARRWGALALLKKVVGG